MALLNSCCCWRSVRKGSFAVSIYSLVYYMVLAMSLWQYTERDYGGTGEEEVLEDRESVIGASTETHTHYQVTNYLGLLMLSLSLFGLVTCVLLFIGLCKDVPVLLLPWVVVAGLVVMVDIIFVIYILHQEHLTMNPVLAITFTVDFFLMVLHTYGLLCVASQYQEYRAGRGAARHDMDRPPPVVHYSHQSTLNSGAESKKTITFLEHGVGVSYNGLLPISASLRPPVSSVPKGSEELGGTKWVEDKDGGARSSTTSLLPSPTTHQHHRNGSGRHVQFTNSPECGASAKGVEERNMDNTEPTTTEAATTTTTTITTTMSS